MGIKTQVFVSVLYCSFLILIEHLFNGVLGPLFYLFAVISFLLFVCPGTLRKKIPNKITPLVILLCAICLLLMLPRYTFSSAVNTVRNAYPEYKESVVCFRKETKNLASSDSGREIYLIAFEGEDEAVLFNPYTGDYARCNIQETFPFLFS